MKSKKKNTSTPSAVREMQREIKKVSQCKHSEANIIHPQVPSQHKTTIDTPIYNVAGEPEKSQHHSHQHHSSKEETRINQSL